MERAAEVCLQRCSDACNVFGALWHLALSESHPNSHAGSLLQRLPLVLPPDFIDVQLNVNVLNKNSKLRSQEDA